MDSLKKDIDKQICGHKRAIASHKVEIRELEKMKKKVYEIVKIVRKEEG